MANRNPIPPSRTRIRKIRFILGFRQNSTKNIYNCNLSITPICDT
nr:MAG TPA: hypothetical protein [Caudoviricetes sp.]